MIRTLLLGRLERERKTVQAMVRLYCRKNHQKVELCSSCNELLEYVAKKLDKCPYEENKPTCIYCKIHCYQKVERDRIREIMRFSGPKMIFYHPVLAVFHLIDKKKDL